MKDKDIVWYDRKRILWFPFTFTKYWIKKDRLYVQKGLFNTNYEELLLYRIIDISLNRNFAQKIFGTGTITLSTRADNDNKLELINITKSAKVKDLISDLVEDARTKKRVHGKEFFEINTNSADDFDAENMDE